MTKEKEQMWEITITADGNDGDYQTEVSEISDTDLNKPKYQNFMSFYCQIKSKKYVIKCAGS